MGVDEFTLHCAQQHYYCAIWQQGLTIAGLPLPLSPIELSTVGSGAPLLYRITHDQTGHGFSCIYLGRHHARR